MKSMSSMWRWVLILVFLISLILLIDWEKAKFTPDKQIILFLRGDDEKHLIASGRLTGLLLSSWGNQGVEIRDGNSKIILRADVNPDPEKSIRFYIKDEGWDFKVIQQVDK